MQSQLVSAHGMLAIMEVLESRTSRDVTLRLLQIVNTVSQTYLCRHVSIVIRLRSWSLPTWVSWKAFVSSGEYTRNMYTA